MQLTLFKPLRIILSGSLLILLGCNAPLNEKKLETPVMGWSSWNTYHVDINDSLIKRQADALVSLELDKAGYDMSISMTDISEAEMPTATLRFILRAFRRV